MFKKCKEVWEPVQRLTWLWTDINSLNCSISISATRTERLKQSVNELISKQGRHAVASVFNQIISMSIVIGIDQLYFWNYNLASLSCRNFGLR